MIVVTSYDSPDLDGIACTIAYTELLNKLGKKAKAYYFGDLGLEVDFVKSFSNDFPVEKHIGNYDTDTQFVLVDTSDPDALEQAIILNKVIEIFDHRQLVYTDKFVNSSNKVELVGSCATLITEEFQKNDLVPSRTSAIYLYSAIISNTINFLNTVTTDRDRKAVDWLKTFINIPDNYVYRMFESKSDINRENLYKVINQDFAVKDFGKKKIGIAQIEIVDLENMMSSLGDTIMKVLVQLKKEYHLDYILFSGIDVIEGYNIFITIDEESKRVFSEALGIKDFVAKHKTKGITMRKQIWPLLNGVLG